MKICLAGEDKRAIDEFEGWLKSFGNYSVSGKMESDTDVLISWGITKMYHAKNLYRKDVPMINFNWDIYEWVWKNPRNSEYDYNRYGELLKKSIEVWCPSERTAMRTKQWFGDIKTHVIKSHITWYDVPTKDGGYALNALRDLPDKNVGLFEKACKELEIPYITTNHYYSLEEFRKIVAECKFICVPFHESSTGGLSLLEAYYLGKPALVSDSPWQSAVEYIGDRATYFKWNDFADLKKKLKQMFDNPPKMPKDHKEWVKENYSKEVIAKNIHNRLQLLLK